MESAEGGMGMLPEESGKKTEEKRPTREDRRFF